MGAPPYGRRVVQRVVLVNVAEPIEFPDALLKRSRPPKLGSEPNFSKGLSSRLRRSVASIACKSPEKPHSLDLVYADAARRPAPVHAQS